MGDAPHIADSAEMPPEVPREMEPLYRKEVSSLVMEIRIFSEAIRDPGEIAGDALLREALSSERTEGACEMLEWMMQELRNLLSLQKETLVNAPEYLVQAMEDIFYRCHEKLGGMKLRTVDDVKNEVARRQQEGHYRSQAELQLLNWEIASLIGEQKELPDVEALASHLQCEDFTRKMASIAPEVQKARAQLGTIHTISTPKSARDLLGTFISTAIH